MLRMCDSTVFWLRKSSAAISGLVLRSTISRATSSSRSLSDRTPISSARARARAAMDPAAELAQLALGLGRRWREQPDALKAAAARSSSAAARSFSPACASARSGERPRDRRIDDAPGRLELVGRGQRPRAAPAASSVGERERSTGPRGDGRAIGRPIAPAHPRPPGRRLAPRRPAGLEEAAGQQLEAVGAPGLRDQSQLRATGRRSRAGRPPRRLARLEQGHRERPGGVGGDDAVVQSLGQLDALLAVASATSTSPSIDAANERLKRFQARAWKLSSIRAASMASSKIRADSATRPCNHSAVPSIGKINGKSSPWPVARPMASARSACRSGSLEAVECTSRRSPGARVPSSRRASSSSLESRRCTLPRRRTGSGPRAPPRTRRRRAPASPARRPRARDRRAARADLDRPGRPALDRVVFPAQQAVGGRAPV